MLTKLLFQRSLGAFMVLAVSIILLSAYKIFAEPNHEVLQKLASRHVAIHEHSSKNVRSIALPYGHENYSHNFSTLFAQPLLVKRAPYTPLTYEQAICNGEKLLDRINQVQQGTAPGGQDFGEDDLKNGWTQLPTMHHEMDAEWDKWFDEVIDRVPGRNEISSIKVINDKGFRSASGQNRVSSPSILSAPILDSRKESTLTIS